jgi:hypothetical protein
MSLYVPQSDGDDEELSPAIFLPPPDHIESAAENAMREVDWETAQLFKQYQNLEHVWDRKGRYQKVAS